MIGEIVLVVVFAACERRGDARGAVFVFFFRRNSLPAAVRLLFLITDVKSDEVHGLVVRAPLIVSGNCTLSLFRRLALNKNVYILLKCSTTSFLYTLETESVLGTKPSPCPRRILT